MMLNREGYCGHNEKGKSGRCFAIIFVNLRHIVFYMYLGVPKKTAVAPPNTPQHRLIIFSPSNCTPPKK